MFKQLIHRKNLPILVLALSLVSVSGIYADENEEGNTSHAQASERLVNIMRQLFTVVHDTGKVNNSAISKDSMADLIESVEELLFFAEVMSTKVPVNELEETEAVIFSALADRLYDEALNVQQLATSYESPDPSQHQLLNEAYHRLNKTCNACHQTFRD